MVRQCGPPGRRGELRQARDPKKRRGKGPRQGCRDRRERHPQRSGGLGLDGEGSDVRVKTGLAVRRASEDKPRHARRGAAGGQQAAICSARLFKHPSGCERRKRNEPARRH